MTKVIKRNRSRRRKLGRKRRAPSFTKNREWMFECSEAANDYAIKITAAWQKAISGILETGRLLLEAKQKLTHGQFGSLFDEPYVGKEMSQERRVPFSQRTAERLIKIARHPILSDATHESVLPASWATLYTLTSIPEQRLGTLITQGKIHPGLMRKDAQRLVSKSLDRLPTAFKALVSVMDEYPDAEQLVSDARIVLDVELWEPFHLIEHLPSWIEQFYEAWGRAEEADIAAAKEAKQMKKLEAEQQPLDQNAH